MLEYIRAVKRALRDQHGEIPSGGTEEDPLFSGLPDGDYPMEINGKIDRVVIRDGKVHCGNVYEMTETIPNCQSATSSLLDNESDLMKRVVTCVVDTWWVKAAVLLAVTAASWSMLLLVEFDAIQGIAMMPVALAGIMAPCYAIFVVVAHFARRRSHE